METRPVT